MRESFAADRRDFERWLIGEVAVYADMCQRIEDGTSRQTGIAAETTKWHLTSLLMVLSRYSDRDPDLLRPVATDRKALLDVVHNGPSLLARCEREAEEAAQRAKYACRGCSGTCCTGVGSEPCTCEPRDDEG